MLALPLSSKLRRSGLAICFLCGLLTAVPAQGAEATAAKGIDQLELRDHRGGRHDFSSYDNDQLVVVVFLGTECPLARMYAPRLVELEREFAGRRVAWVGVVSNTQDSTEEVARFVEACGVDFPVLIDRDCAAANCLAAQRTPEAFVLDGQRTIRYQGRIDDQFAVGLKRPQVGRRDLAEALNELLAGKPVTQPQSAAAGCIIGRPKQPVGDADVTFAKHVAPILNARCVSCHRAGEIAPFSVTSYDEVVGWADTIVEAVDTGRMPPWFASPEHGQLINDARLT
jgi:peroxiredoxin